MLSMSADLTNTDVDLQMINGVETATTGGVEFARELMKFAEAVASRDEQALAQTREQLLQAAGNDVLVDAAGVAANFQRMVRIADSAGIPIDERNIILSADIRENLDLGRFGSASNSRPVTWLDRLRAILLRPVAKMILRRVDRRANSA
jgi:hypothetical protein